LIFPLFWENSKSTAPISARLPHGFLRKEFVSQAFPPTEIPLYFDPDMSSQALRQATVSQNSLFAAVTNSAVIPAFIAIEGKTLLNSDVFGG